MSDALSMKQRMLAGDLYRGDDAELVADKERCAQLVREYDAENASDRLAALLRQLLGSVGDRTVLKPPVYFNYGYQTTIGAGSAVTRDMPPRVFGAGNPCRVIRDLL